MSGTDSTAGQAAMFLHGPRDMRRGSQPHPGQPGPGEALIRVSAVGVCGSDLHMFLDGEIGGLRIESPFVMGHEFGGRVEAVGPDAFDGEHRLLQPGTPVAVEPAQACGHCEGCRTGNPNLCSDLRFLGSYPDAGALQQILRVPAACCFPVPESLDPAEVAMLEPLGVALHATDLARPRAGDSALIVGGGTIGQLMLRVLRASGVGPIFLIDPHAERRAAAAAQGAVALPADETALPSIAAATAGRGVDIAIEAAWADADALRSCARAARLGGRMVVIGIPAVDELVLPAAQVRRKGMTIRLCRRMKHTYPRAIALVANGTVPVADLITHRFPLDDAATAFDLSAGYRDGVIKAVVEIG